MALLAPFVIGRLGRFPRAIGTPIVAFFTLFVIAGLTPSVATNEIVKVASFFVIAAVAAVSVDTRRDVWRVVVALAIPLAGISALGFAAAGPEVEDAALDGLGNRNGLSLFTLPAMLLAVSGAVERGNSKFVRSTLWLTAGIIALSLLSRPNRSGWLGAMVIVLSYLLRDRSLASRAALVALATVVGLVLSNTSLFDRFQGRMQEMAEGHTADRLRAELVEQSFMIGFENPLFGVGPVELPRQLALRVHGRSDLEFIDPHNVFAFVAGGSGLFALLALLWVLRSMAVFGPAGGTRSRTLMFSAVLLFAVRGGFSREVLYSPAFGLLFGLATGLQMIELRERGGFRAKRV